MQIDSLLALFVSAFGHPPERIAPLRADGSNRKLYRLHARTGETWIGVYGPEPEENRAFVGYSRALRTAGLPVPEIIAVDEGEGIYIEEDLGDITLYDALLQERGGGEFPPAMIPIYREVVELLARVQVEGARVVDFDLAWPTPTFDRRAMMWDLNYFKYHFLKLAGVDFHEMRLDRDFERLCDRLLEEPADFFLYRDFQSRNIMLRDGRPWLIDYQGGRRGAAQYDIVSLVNDAKADLPAPFRAELIEHHLTSLSTLVPVDADRYRAAVPGFALIRVLQAMGAYGFRGFFEGKPHFKSSVVYAARTIRALLDRGLGLELPELERTLETIAGRSWEEEETQRTGRQKVKSPAGAPLHVSISSFSYRHGYPAGDPAHGGGFVFDCRALPNPGRHAAYVSLTGHDRSVGEYLEAQGSLHTFLDHAAQLVGDAVENYRLRGFERLQVAFGCTGGQHRSVYCAEALGRRLRERYPDIAVEVDHRERERWPGRPPAPESEEGSGVRSAGTVTTDQ